MPSGVTRRILTAKTRHRVATGPALARWVEVVNNYEIVMRCKVVCVGLDVYYSSASHVIIFSKQQ
jgi:hypothetical protein